MSNLTSPARLIKSVVISIIIAAALLVTVVMPAEYGIDPTGLGKLMGLTQLSSTSTATTSQPATIQMASVLAGNENLQDIEVAPWGEPTPIPNPEVFQDQAEPFKTDTVTVTIPAGKETEIKVNLQQGKVVIYDWQVDQGDIYVDFHGHNAELYGDSFFARYKEQQEGTGNNGSLTAPFAGEHGWYWLNYNEFDVTVTLNISGYYDDIIDYGIF